MKNVHQTHQTLILLITMPSVLWHCWLGGRKGIQRVKNWAVGCWHSYLSGVRCRLAYGPADSTATHCLLLQSNPDWFVLPFWYRLTRVVPNRGALNWCVCVCVYHVWGAMLEHYKTLQPKPNTIDELKKVLQTIWDDLPQNSINKAILSFVKRLRAGGR